MAALRWDGSIEGGQGRGIRPHGERRHERRAVLDARLRQEDGAGLEHREVGESAGDVAVRDPKQARDEAAPQERRLPVRAGSRA